MQYNDDIFDIKGQLSTELDDFFTSKIKIGGTTYGHKNAKSKGYTFNQSDTLNLIEYVGASRFEKGDVDSEGQQKVYMNSSVFRADVSSKQIDIDVKDIVFVPDDYQSEVGTILARKKFKRWTKDVGFGVELNEMVEKFPFYGTLVAKERGDDYDLVPLSQLRNQQNCKDLNSASYVIIEHQMQAWEAQAMPEWDLTGLEYKWDDEITVYERYGRVPAQFFDKEASETKSIDTHSFIVLDGKSKTKNGCLLFIEKIDKRPFKEVHWKKREGRWLGIGEIENNFENQKARNMVFNMRLRSALWSSKQIFQSSDETMAKNLVAEVRDGDVLTINQNGALTQVNTQTKALADYNSIDDVVEANSDKKSFTFEVATGESMPSGTPFRLGVLMANSVNSHFGLKREKLALFVKELLYDFVLPKFYKSINKKSIELLVSNDEGYDILSELHANAKLYKFVKDTALAEGRIPSMQEQEEYRQKILADGKFEVEVLREELKNIKYTMDIVITGESVDLNKRIETLTNLYTSLAQTQDPRANAILAKIITLTGEKMPKEQAQPALTAPATMGSEMANLGKLNEQVV
jgi:hypothetical protein